MLIVSTKMGDITQYKCTTFLQLSGMSACGSWLYSRVLYQDTVTGQEGCLSVLQQAPLTFTDTSSRLQHLLDVTGSSSKMHDFHVFSLSPLSKISAVCQGYYNLLGDAAYPL